MNISYGSFFFKETQGNDSYIHSWLLEKLSGMDTAVTRPIQNCCWRRDALSSLERCLVLSGCWVHPIFFGVIHPLVIQHTCGKSPSSMGKSSKHMTIFVFYFFRLSSAAHFPPLKKNSARCLMVMKDGGRPPPCCRPFWCQVSFLASSSCWICASGAKRRGLRERNFGADLVMGEPWQPWWYDLTGLWQKVTRDNLIIIIQFNIIYSDSNMIDHDDNATLNHMILDKICNIHIHRTIHTCIHPFPTRPYPTLH